MLDTVMPLEFPLGGGWGCGYGILKRGGGKKYRNWRSHQLEAVLEALGRDDIRQRESKEEENVECNPEIANREATS